MEYYYTWIHRLALSLFGLSLLVERPCIRVRGVYTRMREVIITGPYRCSLNLVPRLRSFFFVLKHASFLLMFPGDSSDTCSSTSLGLLLTGGIEIDDCTLFAYSAFLKYRRRRWRGNLNNSFSLLLVSLVEFESGRRR